MKITVADVIAITGGQVLQNGTNDSFNGVSIDSRQTTIGRLFVALRGQKTDGHFFLPDAKTRGAAGALIDHSVPILPDFPLFLVKDTGKALVELGTGISRRLAGTKIAFTGTVGKTTTKWFFQTLLSRKYRVDGTPQSFNTAIGISTSLCNFDEKSEFFLIEAGVSHRGEMKDLVALIEPSIVIFTTFGEAHLEGFGNVESLVQEKIQLAVPPVDVVYLNLDNPYGEEVKNTLRDRGIPVITYGFENHEKRDLALVSFEVDPASGVSSFHCRLRTDYHSFQVPFFSPELMVMLLPALQFSLQQGISELDIQDALNGMVLPDGREKVYRLRQGYVIDDSYNANPVSMQKALSLLELFHRWGYRTWAVLGDMLEMGSVSESAHQNLIRSFDQHRVNTIILYGPMMREAAERVVSSGQLQGECYLAYSHDEIQKILLDQVEKQGEKWVVLFKGSRGMQMEKAIPAEWRSKHGTL